MDYVYICRSGNNEELKYSIRSVVENCKFNNIWLVGNKPDWYKGNFINVEDIGNKFDNISNCLKVISNTNEISSDFVLMNDDFFILKPIDEIPVLNGGLLQSKINKYSSKYGVNGYVKILKEVNKVLLKCNIKVPLDYDIHVPMVFNKNKIKQLKNLTYAPRSIYGNMFDIGGKTIEDVKIYNKNDLINLNDYDGFFISTMDNSFTLIVNQLNKMFPNKTQFEL